MGKMELPYDEAPCAGLLINCVEAVDCSLMISQLEKRTRTGPFWRGPPEPLSCLGFVVITYDASNVPDVDGASLVACGHMQHRANVSTECRLEAGKSYAVIPLSSHTSIRNEAVLCCHFSKPLKPTAHKFDRPLVKSAWVAYFRASLGVPGSLSQRVEKQQGTLCVSEGEGACIFALAEHRGKLFMRVSVSIASSGLRYSRGEANTLDWLAPGYGQIVQVALPKEWTRHMVPNAGGHNAA